MLIRRPEDHGVVLRQRRGPKADDRKGGAMTKYKSLFKSKTLWANLVAAIAFFVSKQFGFEISGETIASVMALLNTVLRFSTDSALTIDPAKVTK
jgi:hypothetical protein